jgi:hypothetical protein
VVAPVVIDPSGIGPGRRHAGRGPWVAAAAAASPPAIGVTDVPIDVLVGAALLVIGVVVAAVIVTRHMTWTAPQTRRRPGTRSAPAGGAPLRTFGAQPDGIHALPGWRPPNAVLGSLPVAAVARPRAGRRRVFRHRFDDGPKATRAR